MNRSPYPVPPGWWSLIDGYLEKARILNPNVRVEVKEKYAVCQVIFITRQRDVEEALGVLEMEVEGASEFICENCGNPGKRRVVEECDWLLTMCDCCFNADFRERRRIAERTREEYFKNTGEIGTND